MASVFLGCINENKDSENNVQTQNMTLNCTVRYIDIEGGFYGLICGEEHYFPTNLPDEYKQDGLHICVKAKLSNVTTIYMWGKPIEVIEVYG
jgi:hypothetical protein